MTKTKARLKVLSGRQEGTEIPLPEGKFLIGREEDCHLRPNSEMISRHHCAFTLDEFALRIRDLGSTNGTFVNGERVRGGVMLNSGDKVTVGQLEFEVLLDDEAEQTGEAVPADDFNRQETAASDETSTLSASDTMTEIPAVPQEQPLPAGNEAAQHAPQGAPMQPGQPPPQGYPMHYPGYGYPAYPQGYPGYYPQPMPYPPQPGYPPQAAPPEGGQNQPEGNQSSEYPDVRLPDPSTTGAQPPEPKESSGSSQSGESVPQSADKIIKNYLQRRPSSE